MKKKPKKQTKKKLKGQTLIDKLPKNQGEWLELCIFFTLRGVKQPPVTQFDHDMLAQSDRLVKKLEEWRANESQNKKTAS